MARTRRAFLAAVGASATLAGCTVRPPRGEPEYRLSVRVVEGADDPFEYDATVIRSVATKWTPMILRSTYENTRDAEETVETTLSRSWTRFGEEPPDVVLLDPDTGYEQAAPGCWTPEADSIGVPLTQVDLSDLPPGTTVHLDHAVWGMPQEDNEDRCLQPGTHRVPMHLGLGVELDVTVESG